MKLRTTLAALLPALLCAAVAQAQDQPVGFQLDLRGEPGVHVECFLTRADLTCALYGGRQQVDASCDAGGLVPTVEWPRSSERPRHGHVCVDEGFHGWPRLREGRTRVLGAYACTSWLNVVSRRVRGHLDCFVGEQDLGFSVDGTGAVDLEAPRHRPAKLRSCGSIAFTPRSDDGVWDIRAQRTTCRTARRVARAAKRHGPTRRPYRYTARGFRCRGRDDESQALPSVEWECVRGRRLVVFDRT